MFGHHHHGRPWGRRYRYAQAMAQQAGQDGCGDAEFMAGGDHDGHGGGRGFGGRHGWGGRGFGGGWGGGRGGGRGGRPLDQGDLRYILLDLIAEKPSHGYELIKAIEDLMDGHYAPSPGVVYPTLTLLEETGLIASETQGVKKLYSLTAEGGAYLDTEAEALNAAKARLAEAKRRFGPPPAAEIGRAMGNLANALGLRLSKGGLSKEELRAVVDAIDAAARAVEQS